MPSSSSSPLRSRAPARPRRLSVVLPYWFDRPDEEALEIARNADQACIDRLWIGEMATFDAFALAGAIARETERIEMVVGPLAAGVRSPTALALGISSIERLGGRPAHLALGASSPEIVSGWHGVPWGSALTRLRETFEATVPLLQGERADYEGDTVRSRGFRLRSAPTSSEVTVAVFGPSTVSWGARHANRLVLNLLTEAATRRFCKRIADVAETAHRPPPHLCLWQPVAFGPTTELSDECRRQVAAQLSAYLAAPGYRDLFIEAGAEDLVQRAIAGEPRAGLAGELSSDVLREFVPTASWGDPAPIASALERRFDAGIDEIAIVPSTAGDPGAQRTVAALPELSWGTETQPTSEGQEP